MGSKQQRFSFAVGSPHGIRSSIWTVIAGGGEVYLLYEQFGHKAKVSLHESGRGHWKGPCDSNFGSATSIRPEIITKWQSNSPDPLNAAHVFRVMIPVSQLRELGKPKSARKTWWLENPPQESTVIYDFFKTPPMPNPSTRTDLPGLHLHSLPLEGGAWITVLVAAGTFNEYFVHELRAQALAKVAEHAPATCAEKGRGTGFMQGPNGFRGMIEFSLS